MSGQRGSDYWRKEGHACTDPTENNVDFLTTATVTNNVCSGVKMNRFGPTCHSQAFRRN